MSAHHKYKVGISCGDINGIGIEVILKTLSDSRILDHCTPVIYASTKVISRHRKALELPDIMLNGVKSVDEIQHKRINLVNVWEEDVEITLGEASPTGGKYALLSLEAATTDLALGKIDALVTAPIDKHTIQGEQFNFAGHTEYLQDKFDAKESLMFLMNDELRVGVVTGHIPVKDIASSISTDKIVAKLQLMYESLKKDFWIEKPKIAVLGLNPHAGDKGIIGSEEDSIIAPAIKKATELNIFAIGPYAADGFFGNGTYKQFDAVLAMYHDQGLIPFKNIAFGGGINFTAGLPVVRTSPDHGTGYDIAGKNVANENSFRQAIFTAIDIVKRRREKEILSANPLKISKLSRDRD